MSSANATGISSFIEQLWDSEVVPAISTYITIPNQSPNYDEAYRTNGLQEKAVDLLVEWARKRQIPGMTVQVAGDAPTPLIVCEIPGTDKSRNVLMYGHFDKQPPMTDTWDAGLHPYQPIYKEGKLYGRGGADDGYSIFTALSSIEALAVQGAAYPHTVVIVEGSEESGSPDLPHYMTSLASVIGTPDLIVCLDSGAGNYEQMWLTTSLRGVVNLGLSVKVLDQAAHSGLASGIVPDSFRIARMLLDRVEDSTTGKIKLAEMYTEIPQHRLDETRQAAAVVGHLIPSEFASIDGLSFMDPDPVELMLNRTWRPYLTVTGAAGLPSLETAGNVLRTETSFKLSFRIPPRVDGHRAAAAIKETLTRDPPLNARVTVGGSHVGSGWDSPALTPSLQAALSAAGELFFDGKPTHSFGLGGSIPFMNMLGEQFPRAQFLVTGVLGPLSNAHGPNEFLHVPFAKRLTCAVAHILNAVQLNGV